MNKPLTLLLSMFISSYLVFSPSLFAQSESLPPIENETAINKEEKEADIEENFSKKEDSMEKPKKDEPIDDATLKTIQAIEKQNAQGMPFKRLEKDVVLFMRGYGEASLKWTLGFEFFKDHTSLIMQSPVFVQEANLSLLILMKRNWYFGINYRDKTVNSELYAGYIDIESDIKKHVRVGNKGINFPNIYPFIRGSTPGASSQFEGEKWRLDSIIRYDSEVKHKRIFYGKNERIENKTSIASWKKAQFFYIPFKNLFAKKTKIYVKSEQRSEWSELGRSDYLIDFRKNMLILRKSFPHGLAINLFESAVVDEMIQDAKTHLSATSLAGKIEDASYIKINGEDFLLLKKENTFSPFEIASIYSINATGEEMEVYLVEKESGAKKEEWKVELEMMSDRFDDESSIVLAKVTSKNEAIDYKKAVHRYPFLDLHAKIYDEIINEKEEYEIELLSYFFTPVADYVLPKETNGDSIEVYINGIPLLDFEYDEISHILRLRRSIGVADRVEIFYSENAQYSAKGKVKIGLATQYNVFEWMNVFFATMSNIAIDKENKNLLDKYIFSLGSNFKWKDITAGAHFGFELDSNRNGGKDGKHTYISKNHFYAKYESEKNYFYFSKPRLEVDLDIKKGKDLSIHSNLASKVDIWKIGVEAGISFQDTKHNKSVVESARHMLKFPLWFFYMDESFFVNNNEKTLSRSNTLKLKKYIEVQHSTFTSYEAKYTMQGISSSISPIIPQSQFGNFFLQLNVNMRQKYRRISYLSPGKSSIIENNYFYLWRDSLLDSYSKGKASPLTRKEEISLIFNWSLPSEMDYSSGFSVQGLNFESKLEAENSLHIIKNDRAFTSIRLPLSYNASFITPFWEREGIKQFSNKESLNYKNDFQSMFKSLAEQHWFFATPPFYDLIDSSLPFKLQEKNGASLYTFSNTHGIDISRLLFESYRDLYIPLEVEMRFSRILKTAIDRKVANDMYKLQFEIKYASQNIFAFGYGKTILKEVFQDELVRNYNFYFLFSKAKSFAFKFESLHKIYFYKDEDIKSGFENKFEIEAERISSQLKAKTWNEKFSFLYSYRGSQSLLNMIFSRFSKFALFDIREERLSVIIGKKHYLNQLNYAFEFSHTQKTKIGEYGEMSMFANFSLNPTNRSSILLNFTIGLSGKVEY